MKAYSNARSGTVERARQLRRESTDAEKRLWRALREAFPDAKFRRQSPIGPYFADFLSYRERLVIEVDGGQHTPNGDAQRTRYIESQGFRVIRVWNTDALANTAGVIRQIGIEMGKVD